MPGRDVFPASCRVRLPPTRKKIETRVKNESSSVKALCGGPHLPVPVSNVPVYTQDHVCAVCGDKYTGSFGQLGDAQSPVPACNHPRHNSCSSALRYLGTAADYCPQCFSSTNPTHTQPGSLSGAGAGRGLDRESAEETLHEASASFVRLARQLAPHEDSQGMVLLGWSRGGGGGGNSGGGGGNSGGGSSGGSGRDPGLDPSRELPPCRASWDWPRRGEAGWPTAWAGPWPNWHRATAAQRWAMAAVLRGWRRAAEVVPIRRWPRFWYHFWLIASLFLCRLGRCMCGTRPASTLGSPPAGGTAALEAVATALRPPVGGSRCAWVWSQSDPGVGPQKPTTKDKDGALPTF